MVLRAQRTPPPKAVAQPIPAIHGGRQAAPFRYRCDIKTGRANDRSRDSRSLPRHNGFVMSPAANGSWSLTGAGARWAMAKRQAPRAAHARLDGGRSSCAASVTTPHVVCGADPSLALPAAAGFGLDPSRFSQGFRGISEKGLLLRPSRPVTPSFPGGDGPGVSDGMVVGLEKPGWAVALYGHARCRGHARALSPWRGPGEGARNLCAGLRAPRRTRGV